MVLPGKTSHPCAPVSPLCSATAMWVVSFSEGFTPFEAITCYFVHMPGLSSRLLVLARSRLFAETVRKAYPDPPLVGRSPFWCATCGRLSNVGFLAFACIYAMSSNVPGLAEEAQDLGNHIPSK